MPARILLTHTPDMRLNYYGSTALARLRALGTVLTHEKDEPLDAGHLIRAAEGCAIVVADRNTPVPAEVFAALPDLAAVLRVAVDIRNIDVEAASRAGVLVTQASRTWVPAVAEHVLGLMLAAARGTATATACYRAGGAPPVTMGRQLAGATAGIIGYGPLGRRVAELCRAFAMRVVVTDPYVSIDDAGINQVPLADLLRQSDFVLPLAVATPETENLIGARALALMKPTALLVNLSRGNLIDEAALEAALEEGRLAGAALDVGRAPDQMPSPRLARRPDVVATPHTGGLTPEAIEGQALETVAQVADILNGRMPKGAVNAAAATRLGRILL
jgi:D-3-phosphoglycerate dehydrogenase